MSAPFYLMYLSKILRRNLPEMRKGLAHILRSKPVSKIGNWDMSARNMRRTLGIATIAAIASLTIAAPAFAGTGCNGVVSPAEWGCAPWDNNNGPQFRHYRGSASAPRRAAPVVVAPTRNANGIMVNNGANVISNDGNSVVSHDGASARSRGN